MGVPGVQPAKAVGVPAKPVAPPAPPVATQTEPIQPGNPFQMAKQYATENPTGLVARGTKLAEEGFGQREHAQPATKPGEFRIPSYTPAPGQPDPRDATYWANVSKLQFNAQQEYGKSLQDQQESDTAYNDALQTAIRNRALQARQLGEQAIKGNLGASGWLDRNEAEQTTAYTQARSTAALSKEQEDQARLAARSALEQGFGIDVAAELAEAGSRYGENANKEAETAEPEAPTPTAGSGKEKNMPKHPHQAVGKAEAVTSHSGPALGPARVVKEPSYFKAGLGKARKAK